jgi:hypothetical protein
MQAAINMLKSAFRFISFSISKDGREYSGLRYEMYEGDMRFS